MCGIAGVMKFGDEDISQAQINSLLLANEHRGNHATGIAIMNGEEIFVHKTPDPAWSFCKKEETLDFIGEHLSAATNVVLLHTRAATVGNPKIVKNNHPLTVGRAAIIHNGCISNDNFLFKDMKCERGAETDSDIIRAMVDVHGITPKAVNELSRMSGSAAIACVHPAYPGKLLLARSGNPIVYSITDSGLLMWASEKQALHHAQRMWEEHLGMWVCANRVNIKFATMPDNTAWIIGEKGKEWHGAFKVAYNFTPVTYRVNDTYAEKMKKWNEEVSRTQGVTYKRENGKEYLQCPKCEQWSFIPFSLKDSALSELFCKHCDVKFGQPKGEKVVSIN